MQKLRTINVMWATLIAVGVLFLARWFMPSLVSNVIPIILFAIFSVLAVITLRNE